MVRFHISAQKNQKLTCWTPLATNRTPNCMGICMENRTCRQPLTLGINFTRATSQKVIPRLKQQLNYRNIRDRLLFTPIFDPQTPS
jgi:hypothetical protein